MRWFVLALCYITMIDRAAAGDVQDAAEALRRGQYPKAIKLLDAVLADEPNQARARAMRGRAHLEAKAYDKAAADFTAAIEAKSAAPQGEAYLGRGRAWYGLGKCDEALVDLNKAVELKPRSAACYFHRGRVLQTKRDFDAALRDFDHAVELNDAAAAYFIARGQLNFERGARFVQYAAERDGKTFTYQQPEGIVDRGRVDAAIADWTKAAELDAAGIEAYELRALAWRVIGDQTKHVADLKQAVERDPDNAERLNHSAWILAVDPDPNVRDGKTALAYAEKACALTKRQNVRFLDTLAAALAENGRFRRAAVVQKQVIDLVKREPGADAADFETRLELYQAGKPFHLPPTTPGTP